MNYNWLKRQKKEDLLEIIQELQDYARELELELDKKKRREIIYESKVFRRTTNDLLKRR